MYQLYGYFRSSTAYRLRIALHLKEQAFENISVHLVKGEQKEEDYTKLNPLGAVPTLITPNGDTLIQSMSILEWLDETHPTPPLLPKDGLEKARVRALMQTIGCELHPINNLRVLKYLVQEMGQDEDAKQKWYQHWIAEGFAVFEQQLTRSAHTGTYCHGDTPTLADVCLVPQVYNAQRFNCDMSPYPETMRIFETCEKLDAFQKAHPSQQPDAA